MNFRDKLHELFNRSFTQNVVTPSSMYSTPVSSSKHPRSMFPYQVNKSIQPRIQFDINDYKGKSLHKSLSMNKSTKSFTAANSLNTSMSSVVTVKQPTSNTKDLKKRMNMFKHEFDIVDSKYVNKINSKSKKKIKQYINVDIDEEKKNINRPIIKNQDNIGDKNYKGHFSRIITTHSLCKYMNNSKRTKMMFDNLKTEYGFLKKKNNSISDNKINNGFAFNKAIIGKKQRTLSELNFNF